MHWKAIFCLPASFGHHFHLASGPLPRASHRAQKSGLHFSLWALLGHLGFCKGLRLWLPLWGLISPVCTVETLPQMVAKKTCLPDPMTWILWNADRVQGSHPSVPWLGQENSSSSKRGVVVTLSSGRAQDGSGQFDSMGHESQAAWDSWRPHKQKSAWGRSSATPSPGLLILGREFSSHV